MPPTEPKSSAPRALPGRGVREDEIELGRVTGVFGVRGEVRLHLHNRDSFLLDGASDVVLVAPDGRRVSARLRARPGAGKRILGAIDGVTQREGAAGWMKWRVVVASSALPDLDDDEFYVHRVVGQPVWMDGARVGEVVAVHPLPEVDLLEIALDAPLDGEREAFVPALAELLTLDADRVVLAPGALDPE